MSQGNVIGVAKPRSLSSHIVPLVLAVLVLGAGFLAYRAGDTAGSDFASCYEASKVWQSGKTVYAEHSFEGQAPFGPVFLLMLVPLTWLDISRAQLVWVGASILLLLYGLHLLVKMLTYEALALGPRAARHAPWLALLLIGPFLHEFIFYRQTGLVALSLTLFAIYLLARHRDVWAGPCLAIAAAIHVLPLALLPWLLYKSRWLAACTFVIAFAIVTALPMLFPDQGYERTRKHYEEYAGLLWQNVGEESQAPTHQSLQPLVLSSIAPHYDGAENWDGKRNFMASNSLFSNRQWIIRGLSAALLALCMFWIRWGYGRNALRCPSNFILLGEASLVLGTAILLSPLSRTNDYIWLYPAAVFLLSSAFGGAKSYRHRSWPAVFAFVLLLTLPHAHLLGLANPSLAQTWQIYHGSAVGLLVMVLLLGWTLHSEVRVLGMRALREALPSHHRGTEVDTGTDGDTRTDARHSTAGRTGNAPHRPVATPGFPGGPPRRGG